MPRSRITNTHSSYLTAVVANARGEIFDLEGYAAIGRADQKLVPLTIENTQAVDHGAELMYLPDRRPVVLNLRTGCMQTLSANPYQPHEPVHPVAVFNSPGYVNCYLSAYHEIRRAGPLPLFSYGAAGWHAGRFRSAVVQVDSEPRQDLRLMNMKDVRAGIERTRHQLPANRLVRHLERCATIYGCPAAKNFFLERYEAPLPTARSCNAHCLGCLSSQTGSSIPHSQDRIDFTPTPEEIAEVALHHIQHVENSIVSFGQGCEGDPLLAADVITSAIGMIRSVTADGTINVNTNGSLPGVLDRLLDAGLDSVRISMNSVRKDQYCAYFRPRGYHFEDVLASIELAVARGRFVSINYLNCAGFTDSEKEAAALIEFIDHYGLHMIQWRNLNYDPLAYWKKMTDAGPSGQPVGMRNLLVRVRKAFPELLCGYFNPPKERFGGSSG